MLTAVDSRELEEALGVLRGRVAGDGASGRAVADQPIVSRVLLDMWGFRALASTGALDGLPMSVAMLIIQAVLAERRHLAASPPPSTADPALLVVGLGADALPPGLIPGPPLTLDDPSSLASAAASTLGFEDTPFCAVGPADDLAVESTASLDDHVPPLSTGASSEPPDTEREPETVRFSPSHHAALVADEHTAVSGITASDVAAELLTGSSATSPPGATRMMGSASESTRPHDSTPPIAGALVDDESGIACEPTVALAEGASEPPTTGPAD